MDSNLKFDVGVGYSFGHKFELKFKNKTPALATKLYASSPISSWYKLSLIKSKNTHRHLRFDSCRL